MKNSMNVLHIVAGSLNGGAARGAYWLHKGLRSQGINSKIVTQFPSRIENTIALPSRNRVKRIKFAIKYRIENYLLNQYSDRKKIIFSTGFLGNDITMMPEYQEADIVHLHWINNYMLSIKNIGKIKKPIVWTLRDMWPMTGGCHYSMDCIGYKTGCGSCEQLHSNTENDISRKTINLKKRYFPKDMNLVGISSWISNAARESELFKNYNIRTISNNINTDIFFPVEKNIAKKALNINTNKKIILVGSTKLEDFYKGFDKFLEALYLIDKEKYFVCLFGASGKEIEKFPDLEYRNFGYLSDNISLQLLYSASDVFVAPSKMEAFGKTVAESLSCGTPAVCFDSTGPKDIVDHRINGYLAAPFDSTDLARGIEWVLNTDNYDELCMIARKKALEKFDSKVVAKQYIELYKEVLNG